MATPVTDRESEAARPRPAASLHVALLTPSTWPEVRRGAERMFRELAGGLVGREHRVTLVTSHPGLPSRRREGGAEVVRTWRPPDGRLRRRGFEDFLTHVPGSYLALRRLDPDLAHASHAPDAVAAVRWGRRRGRPVVFSHMGIPDRRELVERRLRLELTLEAVRGAAAVVALSRHSAAEFERWLGVRARVIHPGVDLEAFRPGGERKERPTILCTSPLGLPPKRVDLLLAALPLVRRSRRDVRLVLQRPPDPALARHALDRGPGVELMDTDPGLLAAAYRAAWVTALPSVGEAFGLVLAESLACGTPGVGRRAGGIPEVLNRPEVGCTFAGDDPAELARALLEGLELAEDPATAATCRTRAEELSLERCVTAYEDLYRELLGA
jgi:glycosyltransferase involved in cell wall biosynthesis